METGDKVWYTIPEDEPREWTVMGIWDTNTADGKMVYLSRPDDTKKLGVTRCNALLNQVVHDQA